MIPGSHAGRALVPHTTFQDPQNLALAEKADDVDESLAEDLLLEPGQISLHDIFLVHGSVCVCVCVCVSEPFDDTATGVAVIVCCVGSLCSCPHSPVTVPLRALWSFAAASPLLIRSRTARPSHGAG